MHGDTGRVRLVDTSDGRELDLDVEAVGRAWFSPDNEVAVIGNSESHGGTAFFDTSSGELLAHFGDTPRFGGLAGAFTPDGTKALIGSFEGGLFVFDRERLLSGDLPNETLDIEVHAHETLIVRVLVSPDGTTAATAAWDEPLKLWDIETGQPLGEFGTGGFNTAHQADFHPTLPYLLVTTPARPGTDPHPRHRPADRDRPVQTEPRHDRTGVPAVLPRALPDGSIGRLNPPARSTSRKRPRRQIHLNVSDPEAAGICVMPTRSPLENSERRRRRCVAVRQLIS